MPASSVTLVVKAPNQKIADQRIECTDDWMVKELKRHLSQVYPTNPVESQQRIIYSGRLLNDNQRLKDVLKQYEPDQYVHTIHLVCSASMLETPSLSQITSGNDVSTEGLRQRFPAVAPSSESTGTTPRAFSPLDYRSYIPHPGMMYYYGNTNLATAMGGTAVPPSTTPSPGFVPSSPGFMPYGVEQLQWMQQAYAQSMMHYMQQYHQQAATQPYFIPPTTPIVPANQNFPNEFPAAAALEGPDGARPIQPIGMNAHEGRDIDANEGELVNRDWLDKLYMLIRFMMLLPILYFYSSPHRFLVSLMMMMVLVYRAGWLRRAAPVENQNPVQRRAPEENREERRPAENQENEQSEPVPTMIDLQATHRPSTFEVIWSIVSSFFTSLIPENPAPIRIN